MSSLFVGKEDFLLEGAEVEVDEVVETLSDVVLLVDVADVGADAGAGATGFEQIRL